MGTPALSPSGRGQEVLQGARPAPPSLSVRSCPAVQAAGPALFLPVLFVPAGKWRRSAVGKCSGARWWGRGQEIAAAV